MIPVAASIPGRFQVRLGAWLPWGILAKVALILGVSLWIVGHGCHGPEVDHEPCLALDSNESRER